jgi:hypothetical protein
MGLKQRQSLVLSALEEAAVVAVRVQMRLPLDDLCSVMRDAIFALVPQHPPSRPAAPCQLC